MNVHSDQNTESFFVGIEVEHTPTFGMETLFVIGTPDIEEIQKHVEHTNVSCIYFGANHSFKIHQSKDWFVWETMIKHFLKQNFWCTLDMDSRYAEGVLESGLTEYSNFVSMISLKLPYIDQYGYNAVLKIDDKGFNDTNPGVWCHSVRSLMDRQKFTDWKKYDKDCVIETV